jgi:predicted ATPase/DNA-binding CsgD family transcriptional regulator
LPQRSFSSIPKSGSIGSDMATSSLPRPLSSFLGREDVLAEATELLGRSRLLTLTGPGGSGKTRLGIELAQRLLADYPDGAHFVPLAAVRDPDLVPSAIAQRLGLQDSRGLPLVEHLGSYLRDRTMLLVLDNFEHVVYRAPVVAELLAAGGATRVVVTSRAPLRIVGEQEFPVPPLPVLEPDAETTGASLTSCPSTALFLARARAVVPRFTVDDEDAAAIAAIVRRLDGLPLAIELAAARVKLLPPASILTRLDHSLGLLVGGGRDLPDRQQNLRSTIAWSYDLLSDGARRLLAVLAVFRGGAALADLERVCEETVDLDLAVLDGVQELLDQSLVRLSGASEPRYAMLETVGEFAAERLAELPKAERVHAAHAAVFASLAERVERPPIWPDNAFLTLLDREHDNLRAALDWLQDHDPAAGLRMAAKLTAFWSNRGHFTEGRRRLHHLLALVPVDSPDRVAAMNGAGWLALDQGELSTSTRLLDESLALARATGDRIGEGTALLDRGRTALGGPDITKGGRDIGAALAMLTRAGDAHGAAAALMFHGLEPMFSGQLDTACARLEQCVAQCEELGLTSLRGRALQLLGLARLRDGDVPGARAALGAGVPVVVESGDRFGITVGLAGLIALAAATDRPRLALRLVGVLDGYVRVNQVVPPQPLGLLTDEFLAATRAAVGASAEALQAEGRRLSLQDALAAALSNEPEQAWRTGRGPGLTRREIEVAQLVAGGLTNREVAGRLYLSVRTVDVHVDRILTKLGFRSRTQLTAWAHAQGLAGESYATD